MNGEPVCSACSTPQLNFAPRSQAFFRYSRTRSGSAGIRPDWQTSEHAGAGAMFQIVEGLEDGRDRSVDHSVRFSSVADVERDLAQGVFPGDEVDVSLEDS